jgi:hypothetical protein
MKEQNETHAGDGHQRGFSSQVRGPARYALMKYETNVNTEAITITTVQTMAKYF